MQKPAQNRYPIHNLIATRWSPRAFADRAVEAEKLRSLFEAARWSASCFNEQPWRFVVALKDDPVSFDAMCQCLNESNRRWAPSAPVLILTAYCTHFAYEGDPPNRHAAHDLGLAVQNLTVQATSEGLIVHQIAGILPEVARQTYAVPPAYEIMTILAVGYQGTLSDLDERYHERELAPRQRKPLSDLVFSGAWGQPAPLINEAE